MPKDREYQIALLDKVIADRDFNGLFQLSSNDDFSIALYEILIGICENDLERLNDTQRTILICMLLENAGQADHILSFLQEGFKGYAEVAVSALHRIGAVNSSKLIEKAVQLLPKDGSWFFDTADEESIERMSRLDGDFSNYPDGAMSDLYRKYANEHRSDF